MLKCKIDILTFLISGWLNLTDLPSSHISPHGQGSMMCVPYDESGVCTSETQV